MSRSFKKTPVCKDGTGTKGLQWAKRQANKKVRRIKEISSKKAYKKVYETWNIHDYSSRKTLKNYRKSLESRMKHYIRCHIVDNDVISVNLSDLDGSPRFKHWRKYYYWK
ncbi:MAG: hypothetical protein N2645_08640 [Clostridia bacterium]|nr:hypothetical protein [Clostridia bacterium]